MAKRVGTTQEHIHNNSHSWMSPAALALSVLALIFSFAAMTNKNTQVPQQTSVSTNITEADEGRNESLTAARERLTNLQNDIQSGANQLNPTDELAQVRSDIGKAYENAQGATRDERDQLLTGLSNLEDEIRTGSANVLNTFASLLQMLSSEVRVDEEND